MSHRAAVIQAAPGGERFESLDFVCNCATDLRNQFVHGSPVRFDREGRNESMGFLTDTLEFVFLASELVKGGWDMKRLIENGTSMTHTFGSVFFGKLSYQAKSVENKWQRTVRPPMIIRGSHDTMPQRPSPPTHVRGYGSRNKDLFGW